MSTVDKFIKDVRKTARDNGIKIKLINTVTVYADGEEHGCQGYFDEETLCVSTDRQKTSFLGLLAHESSHMDQFIEDQFLWIKCSPAYDIFFGWLDNIHSIVKREVLEETVQDIIRLELDCEKRSIEKIIKYNLPIDIPKYIQGVNCYMYSYLFALETKKWTPTVYHSMEAIRFCAKTIKKEYVKIPRRVRQIFLREYNSLPANA